ncbi:hypothetical protein LTR37_002881 [Vermiconidia calcicola]|uniref:Uncharacterized protein n=1 Tax=Vermiconidia calcicola TaxID=1690605 RepID=A0ACC3NS89_9PEZI|nr:hypothetical protein LTR37_002881 [Vermiconidia calcicola]
MGEGAPYLYTPERTVYPYSSFNPKAVTQASIKAAEDSRKPRPKQDGPLINFNAHPDSYMIVAGQNVNYKPMPARTKKEVAILRWVQFALRILEEICALGLLVCVICLRGMAVSLSWIMRIAPAWDAVITLYAIYHLVRPAKARTPASSASYHMFSLFMDTGLLPFYIFIALYSYNNYLEQPGTEGRWTSFFNTPGTTTLLLFVTFAGSVAISGMHLFSAVLDLWLVVLFRKISKLPPDCNPLEDNLTSRGPSKHKYKNSDATLVGSMTEKKPQYLSGSTISVDQRSRLSTATARDENPDFRAVPFYHSRNGSQAAFSPHNPESARYSRQQYDSSMNFEQQVQSAAGSRVDLLNYSHTGSTAPSKRGSVHGSVINPNEVPPPPSKSPNRYYSMHRISQPESRSRAGTTTSELTQYPVPALPNAAPSTALVRTQQQQSLLNNNWLSVDDDEDDGSDLGSPSHFRQPIPTVQLQRQNSWEPQPLRMNPPTPSPPPPTYPDADDDYEQPVQSQQKRNTLTERRDNGNGNLSVQRKDTTASSVYSESAPSLRSSAGTPKGKYYGDLAAAQRGVRGNSPPKSPGWTMAAAVMGGAGMMTTMDTAPHGYSSRSPPPRSPPPQQKQKMWTPKNGGGGGRVVSRTGVDVTDSQSQAQNGGGYSILSRREVSGKIAEEGRGGAWFGGRAY